MARNVAVSLRRPGRHPGPLGSFGAAMRTRQGHVSPEQGLALLLEAGAHGIR